jgi:hypothetical protein
MERYRNRAGTVLTLLRNPLRTLAAFTDRDLGILIGFSRITGGVEGGRERELNIYLCFGNINIRF